MKILISFEEPFHGHVCNVSWLKQALLEIRPFAVDIEI